MKITTLQGRQVEANPDYTIDQDWEHYTPEEHARWDELYRRQSKMLEGKACDKFLEGLGKLRLSKSGIPNYERLSERLFNETGWRVVAVPDLVPDPIFFEHLANKRFPASNFIRPQEQMDYIQEPDLFHDIFGHVPMLAQQAFADYMEAYGKLGMKAVRHGLLKNLASLYWFSVEFGLIKTEGELKVFGAGIFSSKVETDFSLNNPSPNRIEFDLRRIMRTDYRNDDFQQTYFYINSYEELFDAIQQDFDEIFESLKGVEMIPQGVVLPSDNVLHLGTQAYDFDKLDKAG